MFFVQVRTSKENFESEKALIRLYPILQWSLWTIILIGFIYSLVKNDSKMRMVQVLGHIMMLRTWLGTLDIEERSLKKPQFQNYVHINSNAHGILMF